MCPASNFSVKLQTYVAKSCRDRLIRVIAVPIRIQIMILKHILNTNVCPLVQLLGRWGKNIYTSLSYSIYMADGRKQMLLVLHQPVNWSERTFTVVDPTFLGAPNRIGWVEGI